MTQTAIPTTGGNAVPSLRRVSAQPALNTKIQLASTTLITCPALHAVRNPVILVASVYLLVAEDATMDFQLFRDGAEISVFQRFRQVVKLAAGTQTISVTWYDIEPGIAPVYSMRGFANAYAAGNTAATNSRMSAFI